MATTLRRRIPRDDHLVVFDKCLDLGQKFADEINGTSTEAARGAREVAETSVRSHENFLTYDPFLSSFSLDDEPIVLSMI